MDAVATVPVPVNEPVRTYAPGSAERAALVGALEEVEREVVDLPLVIGGSRRLGGGELVEVVQPHDHRAVLGRLRQATEADAAAAADAAADAAAGWRELPFEERAAVFLRAADLLSGPWRARLCATTMLGQSKTAPQAEIDAACELADFWRFNVAFARRLLAEQPQSAPGVWNRMDHRPLEGFVYAITPFNFTAIAGNLPTAPALLGNVVVWKPSPTQQLAASATLELLEAAGLPPGVINLLTGDGRAASRVLLRRADLAGIHFTGSTATFRFLWAEVASHLADYRNYPRLVGETGGKDFVVAHPSADPASLVTALVRGAYEYQGQKCSAVSRAYLPASLWRRIEADLVDKVNGLTMGDVRDWRNFLGAVIDRRAFDRLRQALQRAAATPSLRLLAGGEADDSTGYFVRPTLLVGEDPGDEAFSTEYFGPILSVYVYPDDRYAETLDLVEQTSPYGLTGSIFATERSAIVQAMTRLRYAAGNFYVNDKPTGAVVGQQPFGGARASGTNDKAGSLANLLRWTSPRAIKETFVPPTDYRYPSMGPAETGPAGSASRRGRVEPTAER